MEAPPYTLSTELMEEIREAFTRCDPDKTGMIHPDDLGPVMRALGFNQTESEFYRYVEELDAEYTGKIEFADFVEFMSSKYQIIDQKEYQLAAFKIIDREGDGFITHSKLRGTFANLGEKITDEDFDNVFREVDIDGDGVVNLKDFLEAFKN